MRFLFNCAKLREKAVPLTEGRPEKEYAYVAIDGERREVDAYVTNYFAVSGWQCGTVGRYRLSPLVDGEALADFLESNEFRELAKRIIDGTRIETVNGSTLGFANGIARVAETELVWMLSQLPDHEVSFCTAERWLSGQGDFLEIWAEGTFEEAVKRLEPAFNETLAVEETQVVGRWGGFSELHDIGDILIDEAYERFVIGDQLYRCHIAALAELGLISYAQVRDWEQANTQTSAE